MSVKSSIFSAIIWLASLLFSSFSIRLPVIVEKEKDVFTYKRSLQEQQLIEQQIENRQEIGMGQGLVYSLIRGVVLDAETYSPIPNVAIEVERKKSIGLGNSPLRLKTGDMGDFLFSEIFFASFTIAKKKRTISGSIKALATFSYPGYRDSQVLLDYEMPPIIVLMRKPRNGN